MVRHEGSITRKSINEERTRPSEGRSGTAVGKKTEENPPKVVRFVLTHPKDEKKILHPKCIVAKKLTLKINVQGTKNTTTKILRKLLHSRLDILHQADT